MIINMRKTDMVIFIGCGTGRCGTTSLAKLIEGCKGAVCTHERRPLLPWIFNEDLFQERVQWFSTSTASITGDVAYFYLPYLERLIGVFSNLKIVYLERSRQAVIDSYMWKTQWQNHWYNHDGTEWVENPVWDKTYPKYNIADKAEAIGAYWDDYGKSIRRIAKKFPANVQLFMIEELNTMQGQHSIFDFLEIPETSRNYMEKPIYNTRASKRLILKKEEGFQWVQRLTLASEDITSVVPAGSDLILVDEEQIRDYISAQYRAIPFLEREGVYWGPPPDDQTAIQELDRLKQSGAQFVIFAWTAFWWLDYYAGLNSYLYSNYQCLIENDRIVGFDLRTVRQKVDVGSAMALSTNS